MNARQALKIVQRALENPVPTWLDYTPQNVPIVLYDEDEFVFINHPNPPTERPTNLTAATALEINGILTATIPLRTGCDEQLLVPLVYHECFHVYQDRKFQFKGNYDFFEVLAFYPELHPAYRALCSAETDVLNDSTLSLFEKAKLLSVLVRKRRHILFQHDGLLDFENNLERKEGVASFVERKARLGLLISMLITQLAIMAIRGSILWGRQFAGYLSRYIHPRSGKNRLKVENRFLNCCSNLLHKKLIYPL